MTIREELEIREKEILSPFAALSCKSMGREKPEEECDIRPVFQRDRDRILHCKSFRRLKQKTQVFLLPLDDHYRTRLTHTLEVSQNARTIAKALHLNEDLVEAIALGHDLGHTPFGHAGERALNSVCSNGFQHNEQSLRVVDYLERDGEGLNLTWEVRDGILNHKSSGKPHTMEGRIVQLSDKIAYLHHDIDDAVRGGIMKESDIPDKYKKVLGNTTKERLDTLVHDVVTQSRDKDEIIMSDDVWEALQGIRNFMFERVYTNVIAKAEEKKAVQMVTNLYEYFMDHPEKMTRLYFERYKEGISGKEEAVCDYIAGMTDSYAVQVFQRCFIPESWKN